jgi:hypothetical protein
MMDFLGGRPPTGPKSLRNTERSLASFDGLGLDQAVVIDIVATVGTYVMGAVLREVQTRDARFEFGLDCLLEGIAARVMR